MMLLRLFLLVGLLGICYGETPPPRRNLNLLVGHGVSDEHVKEALTKLSPGMAVQVYKTEVDLSSCADVKSFHEYVPEYARGDYQLLLVKPDAAPCSTMNCTFNVGTVSIADSEVQFTTGCGPTKRSSWEVIRKTIVKKQKLYLPHKLPKDYVDVPGHGKNDNRILYAIISVMCLMVIALMGVLIYNTMLHQKEIKKSKELMTDEQKQQQKYKRPSAPLAAKPKEEQTTTKSVETQDSTDKSGKGKAK